MGVLVLLQYYQFLHHLHGPVLPVENFLDGHALWVSLWEHGDDDVGGEPLPIPDLLHHLLGDLGGDGVVAVGVVVLVPAVGRAQKVLVLNVNEVLSAPEK